MAALIHGSQNQVSQEEIQGLRDEVRQLRSQVTDLTLALDSSQRKPLPPAEDAK